MVQANQEQAPSWPVPSSYLIGRGGESVKEQRRNEFFTRFSLGEGSAANVGRTRFSFARGSAANVG